MSLGEPTLSFDLSLLGPSVTSIHSERLMCSSRSDSSFEERRIRHSLLYTGRVVCFRHCLSGGYLTNPPHSDREVRFSRTIEKLHNVQFRVHVEDDHKCAFQSIATSLWLCKRWNSRAIRVQSKTPYYFKLQVSQQDSETFSTKSMPFRVAQYDVNDTPESLRVLIYATSACLQTPFHFVDSFTDEGGIGEKGEGVIYEDGRLRVSTIPGMMQHRALERDYFTIMDGKPEWLQDVKAKLIQQRRVGCSPVSTFHKVYPPLSPTPKSLSDGSKNNSNKVTKRKIVGRRNYNHEAKSESESESESEAKANGLVEQEPQEEAQCTIS